MPTATTPSIQEIRAQFPGLDSQTTFMNNAGGAQVPASVADAVRTYMVESYIQAGVDVPESRRAGSIIAEAHAVVNTIMGGDRVGKSILGSSSSTLCRMLADCYAEILQPGDEVVVGESGHEANVGPWARLARFGVTVKIWKANPETGVCELAQLMELLSERTKVVAFVHVSNILGHVEDVKPCIQAAQAVGARVVLDGVAYAPHLAPDVEDLNVDWYVFSCYKVFGPHVGALFGKHEAFAELTGPNHYFLPKDAFPAKFELGGSNPESCAGLVGLKSYFQFLAGSTEFDRDCVLAAYRAMESLESPLTERYLGFLRTQPDAKVIGRSEFGPGRVGTVSFVPKRKSSRDVAEALISKGIEARWGNFYSVRLLERMGIDPGPGVVRASFAHYTSMDEVERLIEAVKPAV